MPFFRASGIRWGVDPYLLAAICERESRGGEALTPPGPAGTGDHGMGCGLMQIDRRYWKGWIARGEWGDPAKNISKGAEILSANMGILRSEIAGICAYNAGLTAASRAVDQLDRNAPRELRIAALDAVTTGRDYVSAVLRLRVEFARGT
jgi:soluble lytic murein transglycosylase-like protein